MDKVLDGNRDSHPGHTDRGIVIVKNVIKNLTDFLITKLNSLLFGDAASSVADIGRL